MGDASSHFAKDVRRADNIDNYLIGLIAYLQGKLSIKELEKRAKIASGGGYGYFSGPVDFITNFEEDMKKLKRGNKATWTKIIFNLWETSALPFLYHLSPWENKIGLVYVYYSSLLYKFGIFPSNLKMIIPEVEKLIIGKDWITYDWDKYLIVVLANRQSKIYWIGNGQSFSCGDAGLRSLKKPRKQKEWTAGGTIAQRKKFCLE